MNANIHLNKNNLLKSFTDNIFRKNSIFSFFPKLNFNKLFNNDIRVQAIEKLNPQITLSFNKYFENIITSKFLGFNNSLSYLKLYFRL